MQQATYNLADLFEIVAAEVPERTALVHGELRTTYADLNQRANRLAECLQRAGVSSGDTVGLQLYNGPEYLEGFLAACKLGAMPVNINYRYVADELRYIYGNARLKALLYSESLADTVEPLLSEFGSLALALRSGAPYESALAGSTGQLGAVQRSDDDLILLYTGGTTGLPKGVMWPHRALFFGALGGGGFYRAEGPVQSPQELAAVVRNGPPLCYFAVAPLMHGASLWATLVSLLAGHRVVMRPQIEFDAESIWTLAVEQDVNIIAIVGDAMGMPLLEALRSNPGRWDLSRLMVVGSGGALFSAHIQQGLREELPHVRVADSMGSSESGVLGSGGRPASGEGLIQLPERSDLAVVSGDLTRLLPPGEEGYLARSGHVPVGYFGDPLKSAETFFVLDGVRYANSGDRALQLDDGSFVVLGRGSQCINTGGEKVHVEEVEEVLHRHPAVADAVVTGVPDERWGTQVSAVYSVKPGRQIDAETLRLFCRKYLSAHKVPKRMCQVEQVLRSPAGKADYRWAREVLQEQRNREGCEANIPL